MKPTSAGQDSGTSGPARGPAPAGLDLDPAPKEKRERPTRPGRDPGEGNTANDPGRAAAAETYLQGLAGSGNFPNLAAVGAAGLLHNEHDELTFETGLGWLLTGIAADA
jgi:hypothetical protein